MRRVKSTPWVHTECSGSPQNIDLELEKFDSDEREKVHVTPAYRKYVEYVKKFFHSDDPRELVQRAWKSKILPIFCERTQSIILIDAISGDPVETVSASDIKIDDKVVANELMKIASLLIKIK